jgi:hypothetical protein
VPYGSRAIYPFLPSPKEIPLPAAPARKPNCADSSNVGAVGQDHSRMMARIGPRTERYWDEITADLSLDKTAVFGRVAVREMIVEAHRATT